MPSHPKRVVNESVSPFGADYYRSGNYLDYEGRRDRYRQTAREIGELLHKLGLGKASILDFGCALGFLADGLREEGFRAHGSDISEWVRTEAGRRGVEVLADPIPADVMLALDVFEHMEDEAIRAAVATVNPHVLLARIPSSVDGGRTFCFEMSRADPTHINCKTKEGWIRFFSALGFATLRPQLFTLYDTAGVTCLLGVRQ